MKILIVEDVSSSRLLMVKLVKDLWPEATVESCASGIKALSLLDPKKCCDLIFLDLGLPDIGGFQILELLKAQSPLTKIVTVSDEGSQEVLAESLKCGAVAYVTKPIMLNQMRALLSLSFAPEISANTSKNLLVVDDEKINRFLLRKIVELEGYNVIEATNGLEAVEAVHRHVFEAILMDIRMPYMNGLEASALISKAFPHLPIVVVTSEPLDSVREEGIRSGVDAFLSKPIYKSELLQILEQTIQAKKLRNLSEQVL